MSLRRNLIKQQKHSTLQRYLYYAKQVASQREVIEAALYALRRSAAKSQECELTPDRAIAVRFYLDMLVARADLLAFCLPKRKARALLLIGAMPDDDLEVAGHPSLTLVRDEG